MEDGKLVKKHILYNKLREVIDMIRDKYTADTQIVIGGDFNDNEPPSSMLGTRRSSPLIYSRLNNQGRRNTIIDHFFSQEKLEIGTLAILRKQEEMDEATNFRK